MQTSISLTPSEAIAGMLYDEGPRRIDSGVVLSTLGVNPGLGVFRLRNQQVTSGQNPRGIHSMQDEASVPTGVVFAGVVMYDASEQSPYNTTTDDIYPQKSVAPIVSAGRVWVRVEQAVKLDTVPHVRIVSDGVGEVGGIFRADADTDEAHSLPGCRFLTETSGAGLAVLEINTLEMVAPA